MKYGAFAVSQEYVKLALDTAGLFDVEKLLAADLETGAGLPPFTEERIEVRVFPN